MYVVRLQRLLKIFVFQMKMVHCLIRQKKTVFRIYFYSKYKEKRPIMIILMEGDETNIVRVSLMVTEEQ